MNRFSPIIALLLSGCSLFGPPLPSAPMREDIAAYEARPDQARQALLKCVRNYSQQHARAAGVTPDQIADSALYSCAAEFETYRAIAADRAKSSARILGWIDRSTARTEEAMQQITAEARKAAIATVIESR